MAPPMTAATTSPGRIRPGLIEARRELRMGARGLTDLPGGSARASLKQGFLARQVDRRVSSPGRIRPGLIEAARSRSRWTSSSESPGRIRPGLIEATCRGKSGHPSHDLPGGSARASLKHSTGSSRGRRRRYLPGGSARASLKPHAPVDPVQVAASPGRIRPGLIEAVDRSAP